MRCGNPSCLNDGVSMCNGCKNEVYCGPFCQKTHWAIHKTNCKMTVRRTNLSTTQTTIRDTTPEFDNNSISEEVDAMIVAVEKFKNLNSEGVCYYNSGQFGRASELFSMALTAAKNVVGSDSLVECRMERLLALSLHMIGRFDDAEAHAKKSIEIAEAMLSQLRWKSKNENSSLNQILQRQERIEECLREARYALANVLIEIEDFNTAEKMLLEQLKDIENNVGWDHPRVIPAMDAMAALCSKQQRYDEQVEFLTHAYAVATKAHGSVYPETQSFAQKLALAYLQVGDMPAAVHVAEGNYRDLLQVRPDPDDDIVSVQTPEEVSDSILAEGAAACVLAQVYQAAGQLADAEQMYRAALLAKELVLGSDHPEIADILDQLSSCLIIIAQSQAPEDTTGKATSMQETVELMKRAICVHRLAVDALVKVGPLEAEARSQRELKLASTTGNLGCLMARNGDFSEAKRLTSEACDIIESNLGKDHTAVGRALLALADVYMQYQESQRSPLETDNNNHNGDFAVTVTSVGVSEDMLSMQEFLVKAIRVFEANSEGGSTPENTFLVTARQHLKRLHDLIVATTVESRPRAGSIVSATSGHSNSSATFTDNNGKSLPSYPEMDTIQE